MRLGRKEGAKISASFKRKKENVPEGRVGGGNFSCLERRDADGS